MPTRANSWSSTKGICGFHRPRPERADWTKQSLDFFLPTEGGGLRKVENAADLRDYLRLDGRTVDEFKHTWAYKHALHRQPWLRAL